MDSELSRQIVSCLSLAVAAGIGAWGYRVHQTRKQVPAPARRRAARRRLRRFDILPWCVRALLWLLPAIAYPVYLLLLRTRHWNPVSTRFLLFAVLVGVVLYVHYSWTQDRAREFLRRVKRMHYAICPDCHYSLAGHRQGGHCPECGYAFTPESIFHDWADVYRLAWWKPPTWAKPDSDRST